MATNTPENELRIRKRLLILGFKNIQKKYGRVHIPIISADKNGMKIWVEINNNFYQTAKKYNSNINRTTGTISELLNDAYSYRFE